MALFLLGQNIEAQKHLEMLQSIFDRDRHGHLMLTYGQDPRLTAAPYSAMSQWIFGWPDQARLTVERAIADAVELDHVSTLGTVLAVGSWEQSMRRDIEGMRRSLGHLQTLTTQHRLPFFELVTRALIPLVEGAASPSRQTATELREALLQWEAVMGQNGMSRPFRWGVGLAENYLAFGDIANALDANRKGIQLAEEQNEHWSDSELLRIRGVALAMRDGVGSNGEAEACLRRAIDDARSRGTKSFELRAAMSLARFLRDQGRSTEARDALAPIYAWFTEGFDTHDLIDARNLLDELS